MRPSEQRFLNKYFILILSPGDGICYIAWQSINFIYNLNSHILISYSTDPFSHTHSLTRTPNHSPKTSNSHSLLAGSLSLSLSSPVPVSLCAAISAITPRVTSSMQHLAHKFYENVCHNKYLPFINLTSRNQNEFIISLKFPIINIQCFIFTFAIFSYIHACVCECVLCYAYVL